MNRKEDSSFLQGIESRLDSLFGETSEPSKTKYPQAPEPAVESAGGEDEIAEVPKDEIREIPVMREASLAAGDRPNETATQDKSAFIVEIEKRFSAIFGEEVKEPAPAAIREEPVNVAFQESRAPVTPVMEAPQTTSSEAVEELPFEKEAAPYTAPPVEPVLRELTVQDESAAVPRFESEVATPVVAPELPEMMQLERDEAATPVSSIYRSPLKDMKSIVLSIEWEIDDNILGQFEDEVNKLYLLYTGDRIVQGFLRILRFLGRYIRVRGVSSNQDSVNLLLSVYDHLETVMVSEGITEARKHIMLLENIKKYRRWVEHTDLETSEEGLTPKAGEAVGQPFEAAGEEPLEAIAPDIQKEMPFVLAPEEAAEKPILEISPAIERIKTEEEKPALPEAAEDIHAEEPEPVLEVPAPKPAVQKEAEYLIKEPDILTQLQPPAFAEPPLADVSGKDYQTYAEAIKNMPPHEAYAYALEDIKKTFQTQLDALKEEIRALKASR